MGGCKTEGKEWEAVRRKARNVSLYHGMLGMGVCKTEG